MFNQSKSQSARDRISSRILTDGCVQRHVFLVGSVVFVLLATEFTGVIASFCEGETKANIRREQHPLTITGFLTFYTETGQGTETRACSSCTWTSLCCNSHILFPNRSNSIQRDGPRIKSPVELNKLQEMISRLQHLNVQNKGQNPFLKSVWQMTQFCLLITDSLWCCGQQETSCQVKVLITELSYWDCRFLLQEERLFCNNCGNSCFGGTWNNGVV